MLIRILCCFCFLSVFNAIPARAGDEPACGDFLAEAGMKPAALDFVECAPDYHAQLRVLRAHYRVSGENAAAVEDFLVRETGMRPLSFVCCFWEPLPSEGSRFGYLPHEQWRNAGDERPDRYEISMTSGETVYSARNEWDRIPAFHVTVDLFLEIP